MKPTILLVGNYNRSDFLYPAKVLQDEFDFFFIEHVNRRAVHDEEYTNYGKVVFWKDFRSAYHLLEELQPDKVLFYFIETYCHVALNVACKVRGVPTYHLEHGLRFSVEQYRDASHSRLATKPKVSSGFWCGGLGDLYDRYRTRRFFRSTRDRSPAPQRDFLSEYFSVRSTNSIYETSQRLRNPLRLADVYIGFSPVVFEFHKQLEGLDEAYPVVYTGIPAFDHFFLWRKLSTPGEDLLFIDQALHEEHLFGWTREHKLVFLQNLTDTAEMLGKTLYLRPHPLNDASLYDAAAGTSGVRLVGDHDWESIVPNVNTVLSFNSTLLLPFMGMDQVCCFTLEMHPRQAEPSSSFLTASGACDAVSSFPDLRRKLQDRATWHRKQQRAKEPFIAKWMYRFDGKSSERLREILRA